MNPASEDNVIQMPSVALIHKQIQVPAIFEKMQLHCSMRASGTKNELDALKDEIALLAQDVINQREVALFYTKNRMFVEKITGQYANYATLKTAFSFKGQFWRDLQKAVRSIPINERSTVSMFDKLSEMKQNALVDLLVQRGTSVGTISEQRAAAVSRHRLRELVEPDGYDIYDEGVQFQNDTICRTPIFVLGMAQDLVEETSYAKLCWFDFTANQWRIRAFPNAEISEAHKISSALAKYGIPAPSTNAAKMVQYFDDWKAANHSFMQIETRVSYLGWYRTEANSEPIGFIHPDEDFGAASNVSLVPPVGMYDITRAISKSGTLEAWFELVEHIAHYPVPFIGIYAACASVFLNAVFTSSEAFFVDFAWGTGSGKTTTLRLAASVFGKPAQGTGLINSWRDTLNALGKKAGYLKHFPLIVDESQHAIREGDKITQTLYLMNAGQDRARCQSDGSSSAASAFNLLVLSSGESTLTAFTKEAGTLARVVSVKAPPFGQSTGDMAEINSKYADRVNAVVTDNFGHFGTLVIRYILDNPQLWPEWRARKERQWYQWKADYKEQIKGNSALDRVLGHISLLAVVSEILHEDLNLPVPTGYDSSGEMIVNPAITRVIQAATNVDNACPMMSKHFTHFTDYIKQSTHLFFFIDKEAIPGASPPGAAWLGFWKTTLEGTRDKYVYVFETAARNILRQEVGVTIPDSTLDSWAMEGKIEPDATAFNERGEYQPGHFRHKLIIGLIEYSVIKITREAMQAFV